jgi:hypothetical protein
MMHLHEVGERVVMVCNKRVGQKWCLMWQGKGTLCKGISSSLAAKCTEFPCLKRFSSDGVMKGHQQQLNLLCKSPMTGMEFFVAQKL